MVLGAGLVGAETAEVLSQYDNRVTLVDMLDQIAPLAPARPRENLLARLEHAGVTFLPGRKVKKILSDGVICEYQKAEETLGGFDKIVAAIMESDCIVLASPLNNQIFRRSFLPVL